MEIPAGVNIGQYFITMRVLYITFSIVLIFFIMIMKNVLSRMLLVNANSDAKVMNSGNSHVNVSQTQVAVQQTRSEKIEDLKDRCIHDGYLDLVQLVKLAPENLAKDVLKNCPPGLLPLYGRPKKEIRSEAKEIRKSLKSEPDKLQQFNSRLSAIEKEAKSLQR